MSTSPPFPAPEVGPAQRPRFRVYWKWSFAIAGLVLILLMWRCGSAMVTGMRQSDAAVQQFHQRLNRQEYEQILAAADPAFVSGQRQEEVARFLQAVRSKLGEVKSESRAYLWVNATPNGTLITGQYQTEFASGPASETFTWKRQGETLMLVGYNIRSNSLLDLPPASEEPE